MAYRSFLAAPVPFFQGILLLSKQLLGTTYNSRRRLNYFYGSFGHELQRSNLDFFLSLSLQKTALMFNSIKTSCSRTRRPARTIVFSFGAYKTGATKCSIRSPRHCSLVSKITRSSVEVSFLRSQQCSWYKLVYTSRLRL